MKLKRGLSPVVATVFLVAMVFASISIIYLWAQGFISEQIEKRGMPVERACEKVFFDASSVKKSAGELSVQIANIGEIPINSFNVKYISEGNSEMANFDFAVDAGDSLSSLTIPFEEGTEKIIIYPYIRGIVRETSNTKTFLCQEKGESIDVQ